LHLCPPEKSHLNQWFNLHNWPGTVAAILPGETFEPDLPGGAP
jgi:hypothetical protein